MSKESYERYWGGGGQTVGPYVTFRQRLLGELVSSGARVLDVGCGDGLTSSVLLPDCKVVGVDVSDTALAAAGERGLETRQADLEAGLPKLGGKFDAVLLLDILEHVADPEALLSDVVSRMKRDTLLVVSVPNTMNLLTRLYFLAGRYVDVMDLAHKEGKIFSEHLHVFSRGRLEALLSAAGLKVESRSNYFPEKFNERAYLKFQPLGSLVYALRLQNFFPSLFALGFLYSCTLK